MRAKLNLMFLLITASQLSAVAYAQTEGESLPQPDGGVGGNDEEEILVAGQRPRGSVIGDIEPEITYNGGDIRALGVGTISELLTELSGPLASTRGGQPVVLLEGRRLSSFREIASIPAEAIARAEILPEEVALKYGYPANQKVLNVVLRQRFRAFTVDARDRITTEWDANQVTAEFGVLSIRRDNRISVNAKYEDSQMLKESQRGIYREDGSDTGRSLRPAGQTFTLGGTYAHTFSSDVSSSLNGEIVTNEDESLIGRSSEADGDIYTRTVDDLSYHFGGTLNAAISKWNSTLTATYDRAEGRTISIRRAPVDLAQTWQDEAATDLLVNGNLFQLPAGKVSLTTHLGGTYDRYSSRSSRLDVIPGADLDRTTGIASANVDVPVFDSPAFPLGRMSVNGNLELRSLSDFGELMNYGYGLTWTPHQIVSFVASFAHEENAPQMQQLGNPRIITTDVPVFDNTTGETVLVSRLTGGNPDLLQSTSSKWHFGITVKPLANQDLRLSLAYSRSREKNGVYSLSGPTAETEAAFPDHYVRNPAGDLIFVDASPINIASKESSELRWGINFSKRLALPQSELNAMRAAFEQRRREREASGQMPDGAQRRPGGGPDGPGGPRGPGGPGGGFGGRGPGGGGGPGGRLTFSIYHTWHLEDSIRLHSSLPSIDLLDGGSLNGGPGTPRHEIEVQAGASRSGVGLRFSGNWQSAVRVESSGSNPTEDLRFGSLATFNVRTFITPSQLPGMAGKHDWLRGARISFAVDNIFNERQKVTNELGETPYAYLPAFRDPLGRTISLSLRKQFF